MPVKRKAHRKTVRREMDTIDEMDLATDAFGVVVKFEGDRNKVRVNLDVTMMSDEVRAIFDIEPKSPIKTIECVVKARGALKYRTNSVSAKGKPCLSYEGGMFCLVRDGHLHVTLNQLGARTLAPDSVFFAAEKGDDAGFVFDYSAAAGGAGDKAAVAFDDSDDEDGDAADGAAEFDVDAI